jgi:hypothetical protein
MLMMPLTACLRIAVPSSGTPTPGPRTTVTILDNTGEICFLKLNTVSNELSGNWVAKGGCFSSGCTKREDQRVSVARGETDLDLRFEAHVKLTESRAPNVPCSADCEGSGFVPFTVTNILVGARYSIWFGSQKRGEFLVPPVFPQREGIPVCY